MGWVKIQYTSEIHFDFRHDFFFLGRLQLFRECLTLFSPFLLSFQGDEMKKIGIQPIPMMDRDKKDEVPQGQV